MTPDLINASFEIAAAIFLTINVRRLLIDKSVAGVSIVPTAVFSFWGIWNLFYYSELDQPFSVAAAGAVAVVNSLWVILAIYYQSKAKK